MSDDHDPIAEIERLDRFFDGEEEGERPIDVLRASGVSVPDERDLDDATLHARLWELINAMAATGVFVESTNHLSDRELYRYLVKDALREETILPTPGSGGGWHLSPLGDSDEDTQIYLRYYADDETRERWHSDFRVTLPPKEKPPFDRDRLLPAQDFTVDEGIQ
jgi:hypothetical protein